jgi:two-component system NtrC family sensor kinase
MMLKSAVPVLSDEGVLIGVVYGGSLLNRNFEIVDRVKDVVYQGVTYEDQDMGAATIFQGDLRISTNVRNADGSRAIGTRVSEEVYDTVLKRGETWIERAFVVNNWYITAYEPLRDADEAVIGMLYVGMLEQKYADMKQRTMWAFVSITFLGMALGAIVSYLLANGILKPIRALVAASKRLAEGDFSHRVGQISEDEIGELGQTFNFMASSLKERDEKLKEHAERRIMESERLATIGQLAAGVAHEINNPLGGILVYSHLLLEDTAEDDPKRANLEKIAGEATRCKDIIKGLLDFAHQTEPKIEPADLNRLVESALGLLEDQALFQNINVGRRLAPSLPEIMADGNQLVQVFINIMLNAAEAMEGRGDLLLATRLGGDGRYVEVEITDTGPGIPEDVVEKLFEPFYTTKEVGSGTGLGLSISYGVIERHGGTIQVRSQVGEGATFIIRLPIEEPAMRPEEI